MKSGPRVALALSLGLATLAGQVAGPTAWVKHAPTLNGKVEGSIQVMRPENVTLNGGAVVTGDILLPGTPTVQLNGNPIYAGTLDGTGLPTPVNHKVIVNGGATLRHVVRRTDAISIPGVSPPPQPAGTRSVSLNQAGQSAGDFSTLKNLTLSSNVGQITVPPGSYGNFNANSGSGFVLGVVGSSTPTAYGFQNLTLNGSSSFTVVGPVVVTLNGGFSTNANMGSPDHPDWLNLRIAGGGLSINGNRSVYADLEAPGGTLTLNGGSRFVGQVESDRLIVNGNAILRLVEFTPAILDADQDGMDDAWEEAHGLNLLLNDAILDNDRDGLSNLEEFQRGLHPGNPDSDGDGLYDGDEIALGLNPTLSSPDSQSPTAPSPPSASGVTTDRVVLTWQQATDNLRVSGYIVYRDGQPIETDFPVRETTYTDTNLPDGEEFAYQVRAFDYAGNLSAFSPEILVTTLAADTDTDGLPDEWELKYFEDKPAGPGEDADDDGLTNLQEFLAGSNPKDFFNGILPTLDTFHNGGPGPNDELAMVVRKPDGTLWSGAPIIFSVTAGGRRISSQPGGPEYVYQLTVTADANGLAQVYLEPL